jgi:hypothetical protein
MPIHYKGRYLVFLALYTYWSGHDTVGVAHNYEICTRSPTEHFRSLSQFYARGFPARRYRTLIPRVLIVHLASKTCVIHVYAGGFPDNGVPDFMSIYISTSRVQPTAIRFHSSRILWPQIPLWVPSSSHAPCAWYTFFRPKLSYVAYMLYLIHVDNHNLEPAGPGVRLSISISWNSGYYL